MRDSTSDIVELIENEDSIEMFNNCYKLLVKLGSFIHSCYKSCVHNIHIFLGLKSREGAFTWLDLFEI